MGEQIRVNNASMPGHCAGHRRLQHYDGSNDVDGRDTGRPAALTRREPRPGHDELKALVPHDPEARRNFGQARRRRLCRRPRHRDRLVAHGIPQAAAAARGRGRRRQDRGRQGARRRARRRADPSAMLRGPRPERCALRVELSAPAPRHQDPRRHRRECRCDRGAHFLGKISARAAAARRHPPRERRRCC